MNKANIIKSFNPRLTTESKEIIDSFVSIEERISNQKDLLQELNYFLLEKQSKLKNELEEAELKINSALFGDKKFTTETFSLDLPIKEEYFSSENISITNGIITPKRKLSSILNRRNLNLASIVSRRETDFKILDGKLYIDKNQYFPYQELEVRLPKEVSSGFLYLTLDKFDKIAVLDKFGRELEDTSITNSITVPISHNTSSIVLRFTVNKPKVFSVKDLYVAESSFEQTTEIETKNILINQYLKEIGLNTCDNYSDKNINMKYYISINNEDYREIRPLNKQKNLSINSILSTSTDLIQENLENSITTDLGSMYLLDSLDNTEFHIQKGFKYKLGVNKGLIQKEKIHLYTKEQVTFIINEDQSFKLNNEQITPNKDNQQITLKPGFNTLEIDPLLWNQTIDLLKYKIKKVENDSVLLEDVLNGGLLTKQSSDPTKKDSFSLFLQLVDKVEIFTDEYKPEEVYINNVKYIKKESPSNTFIFIKYKMRLVETIKIKIQMNTEDPKVPAYISSLTIRGV